MEVEHDEGRESPVGLGGPVETAYGHQHDEVYGRMAVRL